MRFTTLTNYYLIDWWCNVDFHLFACWFDFRFCYSYFTWETGGFVRASTIILALQANRLTKCASHPNIFGYYFVGPYLRVEIIFRKERTDSRKWGIDFEIVDIDTSVHQLIPFFNSPWGKNIRCILVTSSCLLSRKIWWAVQIASFCSKLGVFYRPEETKGESTRKWTLTIFKYKKEYYKQNRKSR